MYGASARKALFAVLKQMEEMQLGKFPNARGKEGKATDALLRQIAERTIYELWMRGFAVSARTPADLSPTGDRSPAAHADWRTSKMTPAEHREQEANDQWRKERDQARKSPAGP